MNPPANKSVLCFHELVREFFSGNDSSNIKMSNIDYAADLFLGKIAEIRMQQTKTDLNFPIMTMKYQIIKTKEQIRKYSQIFYT